MQGKHERRARALGEKEQKRRRGAPPFLLLFAQFPRASFMLALHGLKEMETTATQAICLFVYLQKDWSTAQSNGCSFKFL